METIFVKCPNCGHAFDSHDNFWWGPDEDNHPTVENYRCPCCDSWNYDDFTEVVPSAQENNED